LLQTGGITVRCGWKLASLAQLVELRNSFDAVFLGLGLGGTAALGVPGEDLAGVADAVDFIAQLRQAPDLARLPVGRRVVVVGGGMTAIDAAVQAKLLGAEQVTIAYRRGPEAMSASQVEQHWAQTHGVVIRHHLAPQALLGQDGRVSAIALAVQQEVDGRLQSTGEVETLAADQVLKAIGQRLALPWAESAGLAIQGGRLVVDAEGRTALPGVWAGGDCVAGGRDLTVEAVEHGKQAALSIHAAITQPTNQPAAQSLPCAA
ncbi:FAD-dependent oxidoreductase, partial [Ideonella sp. B508-1]|uniref:FAD-dependent oxidoreductase n=1 Tax=Ideonella sp. B508-1 TaxID=137716 RepID=UPI0005901FCD